VEANFGYEGFYSVEKFLAFNLCYHLVINVKGSHSQRYDKLCHCGLASLACFFHFKRLSPVLIKAQFHVGLTGHGDIKLGP
jgi:hypothetical protein